MRKQAKKMYRRKYRKAWLIWNSDAQGTYEIWKHGRIGHAKPLTGSERRAKKRQEIQDKKAA